jgi:hypothetical protein
VKYPDDFLKLRSGASPSGQAAKRAHDIIDAPYLRKRVGGTTTLKQQDFSQTRTVGGSPSLVGWFLNDTSNAFQLAYIDLDTGRTTVPSAPVVRFPKFSEFAASLALGRVTNIGDGLLMSVANDANSIPSTVPEAVRATVASWPMMLTVQPAIKQRFSSEPVSVAKAVSFVDQLPVSGMLSYYHDYGVHATGWDNDTKRYRYGFSLKSFSDPESPLTSRFPAFFAGNTVDKDLVQKDFPFFPGRDHPGGKMYVIGPGKLQQLVTVSELPTAEDRAEVDITYPYFANSIDHGDTWSGAAAEFIRPFLRTRPLTPLVPANPGADPPTPEIPERRAYLDNTHLNRLQDNSIIVYLGEGKSMLIIPNGVVTADDVFGSTTTCAMAFLGTNGSGYTRISWPPDDWVFPNLFGEPDDAPQYLRIFRLSKDRYSAQYAFGKGCMFLSVVSDGALKFLVTYNYGSSWSIVPRPALPEGVSGGILPESCTVIKPYVSDDEPGELLFAYPNYATGRTPFLKTTGLFTPFKKTAAVVNIKGQLGVGSSQLILGTFQANVHFTYFGGAKPSIYPAFPGEFDKP